MGAPSIGGGKFLDFLTSGSYISGDDWCRVEFKALDDWQTSTERKFHRRIGHVDHFRFEALSRCHGPISYAGEMNNDLYIQK